MTIVNAQIDAKYESGINRLVLEHDRIKLPKLVENIKYNPNYIMIDSDWSSSWNEVTKSRLIESFLINIPVTPIIVFEKVYDSYEVIDGRERLRSIVDFYSDRLRLAGLEIETNLEECRYSTLPARAKDRIDRISLDFINCIPANDNQSKLEIRRLIDAVKERYSS